MTTLSTRQPPLCGGPESSHAFGWKGPRNSLHQVSSVPTALRSIRCLIFAKYAEYGEAHGNHQHAPALFLRCRKRFRHSARDAHGRQENMFAGLQGLQRQRHMREIGRGNHDGVQIGLNEVGFLLCRAISGATPVPAESVPGYWRIGRRPRLARDIPDGRAADDCSPWRLPR